MKTIFDLALFEEVEKTELTRIVQTLEGNSIIVEVGSFMGGSAAIMSTAAPDTQIHCFDPFENDLSRLYDSKIQRNQYRLFFELLGRKDIRSLENVAEILKDYNNIYLYKKNSPHDIAWDTPIDLYLEDGIHTDPILTLNLNFWSSRVKKLGYVVLHDHRPWLALNNPYRYRDIDVAYYRFLSQGYTLVSKVRSLTVLQKN